MANLKFPYKRDPKGRIEFVFQHEMQPCPKCGSYDLRSQTPIDIQDKSHQKMMGYAYIACFSCYHKGPKINTGNMTRTQINKSEELANMMCKAWNEQPKSSDKQ